MVPCLCVCVEVEVCVVEMKFIVELKVLSGGYSLNLTDITRAVDCGY